MEKKGDKKRVREVVFDENENSSIDSFRNKKSRKQLSEVGIFVFPNK